MQLKFIYKNNGKIYDIAEGMTLVENYNETLDSATIIISHIPADEKIDIESFDEVILIDELGAIPNKYMCVDSFDEIMLNVGQDSVYYKYQISLFSQVKLLEGVPLPNLDTLQPKNILGEFYKKRTIYDYLKFYNDMYGPKIRTKNGLENKFVFDEEKMLSKFNILCPELQMTTPTLRECFTTLMMIKNCIPTVSNNVIGFIDISEKKNEIKDIPINYIKRSQNSADCVSGLKMNLVNIVQDKKIKNVEINNTIERKGLCFRSDQSAAVNSNNLLLNVDYPIYYVDEFYSVVAYDYHGKRGDEEVSGSIFPGDYIRENEILPYYTEHPNRNLAIQNSMLKEQRLWMTLKVARSEEDIRAGGIEAFPNYQNSTINYSRYGNIINNWSGQITSSIWFPEWKVQVINFVDDYVMVGLPGVDFNIKSPSNLSIHGGYSGAFWEKHFYDIYYVPVGNATIRINKGDETNFEREISDGQTNSYINAYQQGTLEFSKADRFGNKTKTFNARIDRNMVGQRVPFVGDYMNENEILSQCTYQIYKNCVLVNGQLIKNYVLHNYFTGVNAKLRSWKIVDRDEALKRDENFTFYCDFGFKERNDSKCLNLYQDLEGYSSDNFIYDFFKTKKKNYHFIFRGILDDNNTKTDLYEVDTCTYFLGKGVAISCKFNDNYVIGRSIKQKDANVFFDSNGGSIQEMYMYTDNNGELSNFELILKNGSLRRGVIYDDSEKPTEEIYCDMNITPDDDTMNKIISAMKRKPKTDLIALKSIKLTTDADYLCVLKGEKNSLWKTNKEIPSYTLQFNFTSSDSENIMICDDICFLGLADDDFMGRVYKKARIDTITRDFPDDPNVITFDSDPHNLYMEKTANGIMFKLPNFGSDVKGAYYISNANGICFAFNQYDKNGNLLVKKDDNYIYLYVNLLKKRNKKIYERVGNDIIDTGEEI